MPPDRDEDGLFARRALRERSVSRRAGLVAVWIVTLFVAAALGLAAITPARETIRTDGEIVPADRLWQIEHVTGGRVVAVHVREGDKIAAGAVIAVLENPELDRALAQTRRSLALAETRRDILARIAEDKAPAAAPAATPTTADAAWAFARARLDLHRRRLENFDRQIAQLEETVATLTRARGIAHDRVKNFGSRVARLERLAADGHVSAFRLLSERDRFGEVQSEAASVETDLARTLTALAQERAARTEAELGFRDAILTELYEVSERVATLADSLSQLEAEVAALEVRAPASGLIQSVAFPTPGEVVEPGRTLFQLLPEGARPVAELRIVPGDVGHIAPGNEVVLKITTFDFRRYGVARGTLAQISPSLVLDELTGESFFRAEVALADTHVGLGEARYPLTPGMELTAEIAAGERSLLEYFLSPVLRGFSGAFSER